MWSIRLEGEERLKWAKTELRCTIREKIILQGKKSLCGGDFEAYTVHFITSYWAG